jgi:uncharacterized protein YegP (UPF0339 family)
MKAKSMSEYRFVIDKSSDGQYYWVFKAPNNEVMCQSETYKNKAGAVHAIDVIKREAADAPTKKTNVVE